MRAVHLTYSGAGGLGSFLRDFVESDSKNKFEHIVVFYGIEPLNWELEEYCLSKSIDFYYFKRNSVVDIRSYKKVWSLIKELKASTVFLHTYSLSPFCYFRNRKSIRLFCFEHTSSAFKGLQGKFYSVINWFITDGIIVFFRNHGVPSAFKTKTHFVQKKINPKKFQSHVIREPNENVTFGMCSRLVDGKRFDLVFDALEILKKAGEQRVSLRIAGDGPNAEHLKSIVKDKRLENVVKFLGQVAYTDLPEFYHELDVYIHASEGETICYSIMEARSCGLPIIASDVAGIKEGVTEMTDGLLFNNNAEAISQVMRKVLLDESLRQKLGDQSMAKALADYNGPSMADDVHNLVLSK
ncbi:glycosyltransferase family 4 protein [Roseivirga sp.]|uniref:glycosyltransferase family 4 protein n=1 Tax=Roseivirga sp. TaxID=1964215 RepID=UPI003B8D087E